MAAARCSPCDLMLPARLDMCPVCREPTWPAERDDPESNWHKKVERLMAQKRVALEAHIPDIDVKIVSHDGRLWVADSLLQDAGYRPTEFAVVQIRGEFYELVGVIGRDSDTPGWWLEQIDPAREVWALEKQHPVLSASEYRELERRRGLRP